MVGAKEEVDGRFTKMMAMLKIQLEKENIRKAVP